LLDYRYANPFGEVGQVVINAFAAEVVTHTSLTEMQESGRKLYQQHFRSRAAAFAADENAPAATNTAAFQAQAAANGFILDHLPDRFCADDPHYDAAANVWRVPVIFAYLYVGSLGQVGEIVVSDKAETILSHTPFDEMKARARGLYEQNRKKLEAAVPKISAIDAIATANNFLFDHLPDRLTAGEPRFNAQTNVWHVPVLLAYPRIGPVGQTGEIIVSGQAKTVVSHTPVDEILRNARGIYDQQREKIEAVVF
ncbi:MAG: hypothetical protein ACREUY_00990, partial [Burkholderiales bacterium]